jgi:hypothetical protein
MDLANKFAYLTHLKIVEWQAILAIEEKKSKAGLPFNNPLSILE